MRSFWAVNTISNDLPHGGFGFDDHQGKTVDQQHQVGAFFGGPAPDRLRPSTV
jgi:hypothetical protein